MKADMKPSDRLKLVCILLIGLPPSSGAPAMAQSADSLELIAVLSLETVDVSASAGDQSSRAELARIREAATELLRREMSKNARYSLVEESDLTAALRTNGFGSTPCTEMDCALALGRSLGVQRIIMGTVTKGSNLVWFLTLRAVDVQSAEGVREGPVVLKGEISQILPAGIAALARRISAVR